MCISHVIETHRHKTLIRKNGLFIDVHVQYIALLTVEMKKYAHRICYYDILLAKPFKTNCVETNRGEGSHVLQQQGNRTCNAIIQTE